MKLKPLFLAAASMPVVACALIPRSARAENEGDYTPTTDAQWWWKYIRGYDPHPNWTKLIQVSEVLVGKEIVDPKTQDITNTVVFTFTNRSAQTVECDGSVSMAHVVRNKNMEVLSSEALLPARLPKTFRPGESFQVSETTTTASKFRGALQTLEVLER